MTVGNDRGSVLLYRLIHYHNTTTTNINNNDTKNNINNCTRVMTKEREGVTSMIDIR